MARNPVTLAMLVPAASIASINAAVKAMDPNGSDAIGKATHAAEGAKDATHGLLSVTMSEWRAKRLLAKLGTDYGFSKTEPTKADFDSKAKAKIEASGCKVALSGRGEAAVKSEDVVGAMKVVAVSVDVKAEEADKP